MVRDRKRLRDKELGERLRIVERIHKQLKPYKEPSHKKRVEVGDKVVEVTPNWHNDNLDRGSAFGAITAGIMHVLDDYAIPLAGSSDIVNREDHPEGQLYTVIVDASFREQGMFRAMAESGTGFASLFVDEFDVEEENVKDKRIGRDSWEFEILVKE